MGISRGHKRVLQFADRWHRSFAFFAIRTRRITDTSVAVTRRRQGMLNEEQSIERDAVPVQIIGRRVSW